MGAQGGIRVVAAVAGRVAAFLRSLPPAGRIFLAAWILAALVMIAGILRLTTGEQEIVIIHEDGGSVVLRDAELDVVAGDRLVIGNAEEDAVAARIRLHGVACPEKDAPGWEEARSLAEDILSDAERVTVVAAGRERMGVLPAVVGIGGAEDGGSRPERAEASGADPGRKARRRRIEALAAPLRTLQEILVAAGLARVEESGCPESFCDGWRRLQEQARSARIGMWGDGAAQRGDAGVPEDGIREAGGVPDDPPRAEDAPILREMRAGPRNPASGPR